MQDPPPSALWPVHELPQSPRNFVSPVAQNAIGVLLGRYCAVSQSDPFGKRGQIHKILYTERPSHAPKIIFPVKFELLLNRVNKNTPFCSATQSEVVFFPFLPHALLSPALLSLPPFLKTPSLQLRS